MPQLISRSSTTRCLAKQSGFTLIEIIIGIVALSISLAVVSVLLVPTEEQSADHVHQVKAAELAQGLLNEINSRAFDQNSDMAGGVFRCDEPGQAQCTNLNNFGPEAGENQRADYNDVDDYHGYSDHQTSTGEQLDAGYSSFIINVSVSYDGQALTLPTNRLAKRIQVTVTTPLGTAISFTSYKANY